MPKKYKCIQDYKYKSTVYSSGEEYYLEDEIINYLGVGRVFVEVEEVKSKSQERREVVQTKTKKVVEKKTTKRKFRKNKK